jgi:hypothetical protein
MYQDLFDTQNCFLFFCNIYWSLSRSMRRLLTVMSSNLTADTNAGDLRAHLYVPEKLDEKIKESHNWTLI